MSQQLYHLLSGAWPLVAESRQLSGIAPARMDALWSTGWRHFGCDFFRASLMSDGDCLKRQIPLRVRVGPFSQSRSQRRTCKKNEDLRIICREASPGSAEQHLFDIHKGRFGENVPNRLEDFLGASPEEYPCDYRQFSVYHDSQLIAVSFMAVGSRACSSIYAAFDPAFSRRRLGVYTMLAELEFARKQELDFYYLGYATIESSCYDYKMQFRSLEYYDWEGRWLAGRDLVRVGQD
ncbi:MAG: hypothetical protein CMN02_08655 [Roseibacillus sp.]|nr:hypothetical protein [Roseibacillus sp.]